MFPSVRLTALTGALIAAACSATGSEFDDDGNSGAGAGLASTGAGIGNSGNTGFNGEECGNASYGNQVPGSLLVIMDKSGSMSDAVGSTTKYDATEGAINAMTAAASDVTEMGLLAYPEGNFDENALVLCVNEAFFNMGVVSPQCQAVLDDSGCTDVATIGHVPIAPLSQSAPQIAAYLSQQGPAGNTPTRYALKNGYAVLAAHQGLGQKYALLVTDGVPTTHTPAQAGLLPSMGLMCGVQTDIEAEVSAASAAGVATFVIGSPGSEGAASFLSQLAVNGNTPKDPNCSPAAGDCHYQIGTANFQQELEAVLNQIAGSIGDCIFELPLGEDVDPNLVNVTIETPDGPVEIFRDPNHIDGWDYTDATQTRIQLYGPACELYKMQQGNQINIILGCETVLK